MLTLHENLSSGTVTIRGETGFGWEYHARGDGTYESAPYDRSVLRKQGAVFISTLKDGTRYTYNGSGRLASIADLSNNTLTLTYTADGLLQKASDDHGRELLFTYENGYLTTVTDPNGSQYGFIYEHENLAAISYPDGSRKQFIYSDPDEPHNLTRVIDDNNNIIATYGYDQQGRIIAKSNAGGTGSVEIDYTPERALFADDFQTGISPQWTALSGTVNQTDDPDPAHSGNSAVRLHPGSIKFVNTSGGVAALRFSFDLWVAAATNQDFLVKLFDSTKGSDEYGVTLKFTKERSLYSELVNSGVDLREFIRSSVATGTWHRVEIEADTKLEHGFQYFEIWLDCEYAGKYLFKRAAGRLDSVFVQAQNSVSDIYIDNVAVEEVIHDESMVVTTDSRGGRETVIISRENEFNGESWHVEKTGKTSGGCSSCGASATQYDFDDKWNIRRSIDANGVITEMTYDERGNMLTRTEAKNTPLERTVAYTYHPAFNKPLTMSEPSTDNPARRKVTTYAYDAAGNLLSETLQGYSRGQPVSYTTAHEYNSHGQRTRTDGPRTDVQDVTVNTYDPVKGYLTAVTTLSGVVTYAGYDANHNVGSVTDANGAVTAYTYDYAGRVITVTTGSGVTAYAYDVNGNISSMTMPEGDRIEYAYDSANRLIRITDGLGNYMTYAYDDAGNKTREEIRDPQGALKKYLDFEYDHFNRLNKIKNPDNSYSAFSYDAGGNRSFMETVPDNITTSYTYDALRRLKTVVQAEGTPQDAVTEYEYDVQDNLTMVKDAEGKVTRYRYDDFGRVTEIISPDTGITQYSYDEAGNVVTKTDAKGVTISYEYDALNRLTKIDFPEEPDVLYRYDETDGQYGAGRLTTMTDASGTTQYVYDERGSVVEQRATIGGVLYITRYEYNRNNALAKITYPHGAQAAYQRNGAGNIVSVTLNGEPVADGFSYEPFGDLNAMRFPAGDVRTTITRDNKYQIKSIQAGTIVNRTYTHDFSGNISSIAQQDTLPRPLIYTGADTYQYAAGTDLIAQVNQGNIPYDYTYDANGNITADGMHRYEYNANNQMLRVSNGGVRGEYGYNAKGQRVKKTASGRTTIYHYDLEGNLIAETAANGSLIASYIYAGTSRLAMIDGNDNVFYYHNDHLGTPLAMTDAGGAIVWKAAYDPFGEAQVDPASTVTNNFRFPGQYYDEESGLHYNYHRYYDPRTGRYMTADPILSSFLHKNKFYFFVTLFELSPMRLIPYIYVRNNPLTGIDPEGTDEPGCDVYPDLFETKCVKLCCKDHDDCYAPVIPGGLPRCKWGSWKETMSNPCPKPESYCDNCNKVMLNCWAIRCDYGSKGLITTNF
jgi:RHS repeat-associated protein